MSVNNNVTVRTCEYAEIKHLKSIASRERVTLTDNTNCKWWLALIGNDVVGVACAVIKNDAARFKSDYVVNGYRNKGIYRKLFDCRLKYIKSIKHIKNITAFCTSNSLHTYQKNGFATKNINANGIFFVAKSLRGAEN